jgi:hypothetical protein
MTPGLWHNQNFYTNYMDYCSTKMYCSNVSFANLCWLVYWMAYLTILSVSRLYCQTVRLDEYKTKQSWQMWVLSWHLPHRETPWKSSVRIDCDPAKGLEQLPNSCLQHYFTINLFDATLCKPHTHDDRINQFTSSPPYTQRVHLLQMGENMLPTWRQSTLKYK